IDSIKASPMMTMLKGSLDIDDYDEVYDFTGNIMLYADDLYVGSSGGVLLKTEDGKDSTFEIQFDPLPENFERLHVEVEDFVGYEQLNESIEINQDSENKIEFRDTEFEISNLKQIDDEIELTITSDPYYQLSQLRLKDETSVKLVDEFYPMKYEPKKRIYRFKTDKIPEKIIVEGIYFPKT